MRGPPKRVTIGILSLAAWLLLFVFILSPRRVAAQLAWVSQALPSPTPTPTASYALPYPIHAPWPAGAALYAGKDGSYFWDCDPPAKFHCDEDQLALDFNGEGDKDKGMVVLAVADGRVVEKGKQFTGYGYYLVIGHQGGIQSRYAHLEGESKLKEGDFVTQGTPLGKIGASGLENPDHHHLHFALYYCDPKDIVSNQSGIERCLNYQAVYPLPLSSYEVLTEGHPIISENFPVGYEAISNFYEDSQWKNHLAFVETYRLIGGQKALGLTSSPLKPWPNTTYWYQEFNPTAKTVSEYDPSSQKRAALFGDDRQVFYIHEEIWAEYKRKGGPRSSLGPPVFHSYSYRRSSDPQRNIEEVRGDFVHGSIIFIKGGGTIILEEKDADWKGRFYEDPSFKQLKFRRFDQYIDFSWEPKPQSNPLNSMGSAAIWVGKLGGLINAYHIDATIQGHLQILVNGKEKLKIDSPDRMTSGRSLQIGLFEDTIEIRFWQEWDKKARIHITSRDLLSIVGAVRAFESEGEIQYDLVPPPEYDFAAFEPPPFPGVVSPSSPPPSVSLARTATVLVVDVSGSMGETWMGGVKIDSAKSAAEQLINMIEQDSLFEGAAHRAGLVSFTDYAERNSDLTSNFEQIRQQISSLYPFSMTNIGAGLETANEILASAAVDESKIIILLSDGMTNVGLTAQEILAGPVEEARRQGTCIYTVGFGDPGNLDENLLRQIAEHSGCGEYFYATDVNELEKVYVQVRHKSTGSVLAEFAGEISQGETVQVGTFTVPDAQSELAVSLHWPRPHRLRLNLYDPQGIAIAPNAPNVQWAEYSNLIYALVKDPLPGNWNVEVIGDQVPQPRQPYSIVASSREKTAGVILTPPPTLTLVPQEIKYPSGGGGVGIAIILVALSVGGVWLYLVSQKKRPPVSGRFPHNNGALRVLTGPWTGHIIPLSHPTLLIGRSSHNDIVLSELVVSRQHARLRYIKGVWYLQDQRSKWGTYVNGRRIAAIALRPGDLIRIGNTIFEFFIPR